MSLTVTVLAEDSPAPGAGAQAEHGLSLLIEAHGRRVLFDAGASSLTCRNADTLGLGEALVRLDGVVISHGHYDHAGGLAEVLRRSRGTVPVFVQAHSVPSQGSSSMPVRLRIAGPRSQTGTERPSGQTAGVLKIWFIAVV